MYITKKLTLYCLIKLCLQFSKKAWTQRQTLFMREQQLSLNYKVQSMHIILYTFCCIIGIYFYWYVLVILIIELGKVAGASC